MAVAADKAYTFPGIDLEVDALKKYLTAETFTYVFNTDHMAIKIRRPAPQKDCGAFPDRLL